MLDGPGPTRWEPVTAQRAGQDAWLALADTDGSLVTQLDGKLLPHQVDGPVPGNPTSSATMPRLVARMWVHASGLIRLTVTGPGTAEGTYLPGDVSFMMARPHAAPPIGVITDQMRTGGTARTANFAPALLDQPGVARLLAQLAAPAAQHIRVVLDDDPLTDYLVDTAGSWAAITGTSGGWAVRQGGPTRLWDAIEAAWDIRQRVGRRLDLSDFTVQIAQGAQTVRLVAPDGPYSWTLPDLTVTGSSTG